MQEVIKGLFIVATVIFGNLHSLWCQNLDNEVKYQFTLAHDNDFLVLTDRYYTFGLALSYKQHIEKSIFTDHHSNWGLTLMQKAYTPNNIETTSLSEMDRPYAGILALEGNYATSSIKAYYELCLEIGIIGPSSGVGNFQQWYHDHVVKYKTPTWAQELENQFYGNLSMSFAKEWTLFPNPFGIRIALTPCATVGSKDVYIQPGITAFFGRRSSINKSMAYGQIGSLEREIYVSAQWAHRWIATNILLDNSVRSNQLSVFNANFHHRYQNHEYRLGYYFNSKEATGLRDHQYISLSYARGF